MILGKTVAGKRSFADDLRARYWPKSRVGSFLIAMAPWLNVALLALFFVFVNRNLIMQPGELVRLPSAPFDSGTRSQVKLIVRSVARSGTEGRKEVIYFNDQRFILTEEAQIQRLRCSMAEKATSEEGADLIVFADSQVRTETVMKIFNMASEVGVRRVEIATRPAR